MATRYNDPNWHPKNPVIHEFLTDDSGQPIPVDNCSLNAWALLHAINPDEDIRVATPGFVQELYKSMRKGLSQASERNSRSGHHEGTFETAEGTDYYMKFCGGCQWVMLGCFVGYSLPDMRALGKLLPDEWYDVDTGSSQSPGNFVLFPYNVSLIPLHLYVLPPLPFCLFINNPQRNKSVCSTSIF